jgi:hypothetical protein
MMIPSLFRDGIHQGAPRLMIHSFPGFSEKRFGKIKRMHAENSIRLLVLRFVNVFQEIAMVTR